MPFPNEKFSASIAADFLRMGAATFRHVSPELQCSEVVVLEDNRPRTVMTRQDVQRELSTYSFTTQRWGYSESFNRASISLKPFDDCEGDRCLLTRLGVRSPRQITRNV